METTSVLPHISNITGAQAQILDIIDGVGIDAPQGRAMLWTSEDGDDSVFYSDEEQPYREASCSLHRLVNSVAEEDTHSDGPPGGDKLNLQMEIETITEEMFDSDSMCPREHLNVKCMAATEENHSESRVNVNQQLQEEAIEQQTDVVDEQRISQMEDEKQSSTDLMLKKEEKTILTHTGFHPNSSPTYSTLPLIRKPGVNDSGLQTSFDHLTTSKYGTMSYRKIRKGNTRQKIKDFEHMMMNL